MEETEAEPEVLRNEDESMPLVENIIETDSMATAANNGFEMQAAAATTFDKLPREAKELLLQNRFRSRFHDYSSSKKHPFNRGKLREPKNRNHHPSKHHHQGLGVFQQNMLSKKRFITKNRHPWMNPMPNVFGVYV